MKGIKALSIVLLTMFSLAACSDKAVTKKKERENSWERLGLKGKVQSLKIISYNAEGKEKLQESSSIRNICVRYFNDKGAMLSELNYDSAHILKDSTACLFDEAGQFIGMEVYRAGRLEVKALYKMNKQELLLENNCVSYDYPEGEAPKIDTVVSSKYEYTLNDKGIPVESIENVFHGPYASLKIICQYDEAGNRIKESLYSADSVIEEYRLKYYTDGTLQELAHYKRPEGKLMPMEITTYNEQGKEVEALTYKADTLYAKAVTEYDKFGNELAVKHVGGKTIHKPISYDKYEYDEQNNWTSRVRYEIGKATEIQVREITYFK